MYRLKVLKRNSFSTGTSATLESLFRAGPKPISFLPHSLAVMSGNGELSFKTLSFIPGCRRSCARVNFVERTTGEPVAESTNKPSCFKRRSKERI